MIFSFENMTFPRKLNICFENMICLFENVTFSRKVNYLLWKYDLLVRKYDLFKENTRALAMEGTGPTMEGQEPGTEEPVAPKPGKAKGPIYPLQARRRPEACYGGEVGLRR